MCSILPQASQTAAVEAIQSACPEVVRICKRPGFMSEDWVMLVK